MELHLPHSRPGGFRPVAGLVAWLAVVALAAALGGFASAGSPAFYLSLQRPDWAPPPSVFGPVWTVLYIAMGVAAWRVWRPQGWQGARGPLTLFLVQLALNALWTWLFFAWRQGTWALVEIVALWMLVAATAWLFWRRDRIAGALMLPYLAWVGFAAALTASLRGLNPGVLG